MSNVGSRSAKKSRVRSELEARLKQAQQNQKTAPAGTCEKEIRRIKRDTLALMENYQRRITLARAAFGMGAVGAAGVLLLLIMSPQLLFGAALCACALLLCACALLCAAAYILRVQNERALKQVCDFDSVHFAGRIWFDFKSGIRA